jgi:hypothetical protein
MDANEELGLKKVQHYSVMLSTFIAGRMEVDRQILTIAVAALGFIISTSDKILVATLWGKFFFCIAGLSFLLSIAAILRIFILNPKIIANEILENRPDKKLDGQLKILDYMAIISLGLGMLAVTLLFVLKLFWASEKNQDPVENSSIQKNFYVENETGGSIYGK